MPLFTVYPDTHVTHAPPHEFLEGALITPHESPTRATLIRDAVARAGLGPIIVPTPFGLEPVRAVHDAGYLKYLAHAYQRWVAAGGSPAAVIPDTFAVRWMARPPRDAYAQAGYYALDTSAPIVAETYQAARASADAALTAAALLLEGQRATYALCRPPGHHAGRDMCGGYCYLNNAAIAAEWLLQSVAEDRGLKIENNKRGNDELSSILDPQSSTQPASVAILDIDYHHGNGTQQIFYERADVLVVSIHADPSFEYPYFSGYADERGAGAGAGYNLNLPLPSQTTDTQFLAALDQALEAIAAVEPCYLVLSAGFDTFDGDPLGEFVLTAAAYGEIGRRIASLGLPTLIVQEGGYAVAALADNVVSLLGAFAG